MGLKIYTLTLMPIRQINQVWSVRGIYFSGALSCSDLLILVQQEMEMHFDSYKWVCKEKVDDSSKGLCSKKYQLQIIWFNASEEVFVR